MMPCPCCERAGETGASDGGRTFLHCTGCGHVWSLDAALADGYYQALGGRNATDEETLSAKLDSRIASLAGLLRDGMRILEIGCAEGELCKRIKQKFQLQYVGIEPSRDASSASGVLDQVFTSRAELAREQPELRFDLILSFHVLEHIPDVAAELAAWSKLCAPHARLLIEVPHEAGHPLLALDRNVEHLHQFRAASLTTLLQRSGFTMLQLHTGLFESAVYPDSLRVLARLNLPPANREAALLSRLEQLFPDGFVIYGVGGDFRNYLLPLLPYLPPGRVRALHDSNAARWGEFLQALPDVAITEFTQGALPVLISSCRYASSIRQQLKNLGTSEALLFDLSDVLGPIGLVTA